MQSMRSSGRSITFRADADLMTEVRSEAERRGITVSAMIRLWLHEGVMRTAAPMEAE